MILRLKNGKELKLRHFAYRIDEGVEAPAFILSFSIDDVDLSEFVKNGKQIFSDDNVSKIVIITEEKELPFSFTTMERMNIFVDESNQVIEVRLV